MQISSFTVFSFLLISAATGDFINRRHSLPGVIDGQALEDWYLTGSAQIENSVVRLTPDEKNKQGAIWNVHTAHSPDWEIQMNFNIRGKEKNFYGNGMAVWYVKDPLHLGPVFGSSDYFTGLAVFIDTYEDKENPHKHRHPYISAMVNNGSLKYDHDEDGTYTQLGGCHAEIRNKDYITRIAVSYTEDALSLYLDTEGLGQWKQCFRAPGVHLPTGYYYGISASTGDHTDNHVITSITTLEFEIPRMTFEDRSKIIPHAEHFMTPKEYVKTKKEDKVQVEDLEAEVEELVEEKIDEKVKENIKEKIREKVAQKFKEMVEEKPETTTTSPIIQEDTLEPISFFTKAVYVIGFLIILGVAVSTCRKYFARRREYTICYIHGLMPSDAVELNMIDNTQKGYYKC